MLLYYVPDRFSKAWIERPGLHHETMPDQALYESTRPHATMGREHPDLMPTPKGETNAADYLKLLAGVDHYISNG